MTRISSQSWVCAIEVEDATVLEAQQLVARWVDGDAKIWLHLNGEMGTVLIRPGRAECIAIVDLPRDGADDVDSEPGAKPVYRTHLSLMDGGGD